MIWLEVFTCRTIRNHPWINTDPPQVKHHPEKSPVPQLNHIRNTLEPHSDHPETMHVWIVFNFYESDCSIMWYRMIPFAEKIRLFIRLRWKNILAKVKTNKRKNQSFIILLHHSFLFCIYSYHANRSKNFNYFSQ